MDLFDRTDGELLGKFVDTGCEAAFDAVVRRHSAMVEGVCRRVTGQASDAEDAAQAVFLQLACNADGLRGRQSVAGWLHRTAWHISLRARRSVAARQRLEGLRHAIPGADGADDEDSALKAEALRELDRALGMLSDEYREALVLHHLEGMTVAQVAELLGCPPGTVAARLSRGRSMLRERLRWRGLLLVVASHELSAAFTDGIADAQAAPSAEPLWHGEGLEPVDAETPDHGVWETGGCGADAARRPLVSAPVGRLTASGGGTVAKAAAVSPSAPLPAALPSAAVGSAAGGAFVPIAGFAATGGRFAVALALGLGTTVTAAAGTMGYRAWAESRPPAPARVMLAGGSDGFVYRPAPPVVAADAMRGRPTVANDDRPAQPERDTSGGGASRGPAPITPEPSSLLVLGVGALALLRRRRRH